MRCEIAAQCRRRAPVIADAAICHHERMRLERLPAISGAVTDHRRTLVIAATLAEAYSNLYRQRRRCAGSLVVPESRPDALHVPSEAGGNQTMPRHRQRTQRAANDR